MTRMHSLRDAVPAAAPRRPGTALTALTAALLTALAAPLPAADIATSAQYAWAENAGWLNLKATNGGAAIYSDHLEGYAWHENLGWLRLGTHTGGGIHTYANNAAGTYGVNRNSSTGVLSGYAWSENAGWVNFAPTGGGVTADPTTGDLDGYAWGENVGWVRFLPYATKGVVCGSGIPYTTGTWHMLALPCVPSGGSVVGTFGDGTLADLTTVGYSVSDTGWALFKRTVDTTPSRYDMLGAGDALATGAGYWFKSYEAPVNNALRVAGTATGGIVTEGEGCAVADGCLAVTVQTVSGENRYNLVGNPFPYPLDWADVRVRVKNGSTLIGTYTPSAAQTAGYLSNQIWIWNGSSYDTYSDSTPGTLGQLRYFTSFWVNVLPDAAGLTVELLIPRRINLSQATPGQSAPGLASRPRERSWLDWLIPPAAADDDLTPGRDPEDGPSAVFWTADVAPPSDPTFDLLAAQAEWSQGLDPQAAAQAAHAQAMAEGSEWFVRLKVDEPATGYHDHTNVLGQLLTAQAGYDPADLIELPPYATPFLTLVFPHPEWGERAGDYASDYRAAQRLNRRGRPQPGLPAADWTFVIRADRPGTPVVLSWEGSPDILKRSRLVDRATGRTLNPAAKPYVTGGYAVTLKGGTRTFTWRFLGQP